MSQLDALARTLAIEGPVGLACLWLLARAELKSAGWRAAVVVLAASLVTHPFAWWGNKAMVGAVEFWPRVTIVELAVVVIETLVLRRALRMPWPAAAITAVVMNAASFGFGLWWMWR